MITSPLLSELLRSTESAPAAAGEFNDALRSVRLAEADLRYSVEALEQAAAPAERSDALRRRDIAMRNLILALQKLREALQDTP